MPYQAAKAGMVTMALYLAHELREANIAVNVLLPGHTRSTGSDEQEKERAVMRARMGEPAYAPRRLKPEHVVPLALHFAEQDAATGETGQVLKATEWNQAHLSGTSIDAWTYEGDLVRG
jgi:NAD(P)-dependent dehydrogenase (short-subunit alcohol dehydrogenase family)